MIKYLKRIDYKNVLKLLSIKLVKHLYQSLIIWITGYLYLELLTKNIHFNYTYLDVVMLVLFLKVIVYQLTLKDSKNQTDPIDFDKNDEKKNVEVKVTKS